MRNAVVVCLFCALTITTGRTQEEKPASKPVQKGDSLSVKGCLDGGALEATEAPELEATGILANGLTFRLTGDKALLKQLRETHNRKVVSVKGVLKSDLPQQDGQSRSVGRMRITIGGASPSPHSPQAESRRSLPVLEVKSFDGGSTSCGR